MIVDASVALKWVLEEEGSAVARGIIETDVLAAPDLMFIECANVLSMKARRGLISNENALSAMRAIENTPIRSIPGRPHVAAAQMIAEALRQTAYDSLYLAIALAERVTFVTADGAFARAAHGAPLYAGSVRWLGTDLQTRA